MQGYAATVTFPATLTSNERPAPSCSGGHLSHYKHNFLRYFLCLFFIRVDHKKPFVNLRLKPSYPVTSGWTQAVAFQQSFYIIDLLGAGTTQRQPQSTDLHPQQIQRLFQGNRIGGYK